MRLPSRQPVRRRLSAACAERDLDARMRRARGESAGGRTHPARGKSRPPEGTAIPASGGRFRPVEPGEATRWASPGRRAATGARRSDSSYSSCSTPHGSKSAPRSRPSTQAAGGVLEPGRGELAQRGGVRGEARVERALRIPGRLGRECRRDGRAASTPQPRAARLAAVDVPARPRADHDRPALRRCARVGRANHGACQGGAARARSVPGEHLALASEPGRLLRPRSRRPRDGDGPRRQRCRSRRSRPERESVRHLRERVAVATCRDSSPARNRRGTTRRRPRRTAGAPCATSPTSSVRSTRPHAKANRCQPGANSVPLPRATPRGSGASSGHRPSVRDDVGARERVALDADEAEPRIRRRDLVPERPCAQRS